MHTQVQWNIIQTSKVGNQAIFKQLDYSEGQCAKWNNLDKRTQKPHDLIQAELRTVEKNGCTSRWGWGMGNCWSKVRNFPLYQGTLGGYS